ncbi:DUF1905 domain-containing protein [Nakamurella sp. YIM 132087]|uniref:DUF1905 domain-containing protein n=1 Tax=Nakamurella alba TaxID=2665158 RepID=A0A7K1FEU2_9ACTN|nr:DUF1905 domain-containing protein [Nakamurella alba]MTD12622.1 DUF1905 domain-containing protein [Nakamurella alba]
MDLEFTGEIWFWRGPSPFHFVSVPDEQSAALESVSPQVSYGWGMIPVQVRIGATTFATALWPKDGGYIVPVKAAVRRAEKIDLGDTVAVRLAVDV